MNTEFNLADEYKNDKAVKNENKIMWKGVTLMLVAAILDWELFQWLFNSLAVKH
jgi:hypothetical protein